MKNFLRGVIVGGIAVYVLMSLSLRAQVEEPLTLRTPMISTDPKVWTPEQQYELRKMFDDLVMQGNTNFRSITGRMRQID